ncbi:MAG: hypothetical protein FWF81_13535 [Defluviitaleaceae bacterium]|nr:hypothetical protein [Defluviitaleaceae bacterium]
MSNMVVRTNVFALNAHRNLTNVGLQQRQAAQRLSSGFRVNSAADDAAGLAISEAMRAQIRGLDQASINAQDGVGLIQTAEGAMSTISDMVIRVRELMVQAANDTNTLNNREMIQLEIDQIFTEINDVTFRTQFNTRTLLAGGLGGEGGGPSSPVSLAWMVFDQARVIGLGQPGGIVTSTPDGHSGRMPNVHDNPHNRSNTSLRSGIISLQNELNALARRVAERKVADPGEAFSPDNLSEMFADVRNIHTMLDGGVGPNGLTLELIPAERTELQSIANRMAQMLRQGMVAAEDMFQITQDQVNALGGAGSINFDGSEVFSGPAIGEWAADARQILDDMRAAYREMLGDPDLGTAGLISDAMDLGMGDGAGDGGALAAMAAVLDRMVGQMGSEVQDDATIPGPPIPDPSYVLETDPADPNYGMYVGGTGPHATQPTMPGPDVPNPLYPGGPATPPENSFLELLERLLDKSTDVLGNVNLESNAMWFQIGPNSMQGMVLQLQGIHTGILGGGRGDLAMLIDVRERSGVPISEQLEFIDLAEGIVNGQRAQLGAVQNRLEFTRQSLDISSENLSAAESRIRDTDMAREMMRFTAAQVLQQAGISMLAQANQLPASILQLLQ